MSVLVTSETAILPILGKTWISKTAMPVPRHHRTARHGAEARRVALGRLGEGGDARRAPLLGQRITAPAGELAVGQSLLARLRNEICFNGKKGRSAGIRRDRMDGFRASANAPPLGRYEAS